jgi:hypothetical protein
MTTVTLAGKVGQEGTAIQLTGSPARIRAFRGGRDPSYMVRRIVMRHQHNAAEECAAETQERVRDKTPVRSRRSWWSIQKRTYRRGDTVHSDVWSDYPVIRYLEEGTGIFGPRRRLITPKRGTHLRFPKRNTGAFTLRDVVRTRGGLPDPRARWVFRRFVKGQPEKRMFARTAIEMRPRAEVIFRKHAKLAAIEIRARL